MVTFLINRGWKLTERGVKVFNAIEFIVAFALFLLVVGFAGGLEAGTIKVWGL